MSSSKPVGRASGSSAPPRANAAFTSTGWLVDDWLVSEVGRGNEGRGADLARALAALAGNGRPRDWWRLVPAALEDAIRR